jgi:2-acylglycerol O-acyltransferase 2
VRQSLDAHPGTYNLTLKDRKGFVKIALLQGASLVPVFGFGETDIYDQADNERGSRLRTIQELLQKKLGFALPLVRGRGVFNYKAGWMPHRRPIDAVVGAPIALPKLTVEQITPEVLDKYHGAYIKGLKDLYDAHKNRLAPKRRASMTIVA